jgi:hypothetical protein
LAAASASSAVSAARDAKDAAVLRAVGTGEEGGLGSAGAGGLLGAAGEMEGEAAVGVAGEDGGGEEETAKISPESVGAGDESAGATEGGEGETGTAEDGSVELNEVSSARAGRLVCFALQSLYVTIFRAIYQIKRGKIRKENKLRESIAVVIHAKGDNYHKQ